MLYVSPGGRSGNPDTSCRTAAYSSISSAVSAASAGSTVIVCKGTYAESVTVGKRLTLRGQAATVNATGKPFGIGVIVSHVTVTGFTVGATPQEKGSRSCRAGRSAAAAAPVAIRVLR